ncbi:monofunctional biosynthetic peptidoglycan transglycosylase [Sinisalibacter lacisalsi]|uniref:Biosynthetic peptidoglycan transglycosylase n=1 Tax=Sinisalibacter lacisalsi TaxID=1526570 RepID=A0ABQ1QBV8_9RHOB|nr:monofunctional biosynthetic peptidoglycan transglycosylase [Sinisalibacter lacisalsi]
MARSDDTKNASLTLGILRGLWRLVMRGVGRFGGFVMRWVRRVLSVFFALIAVGVGAYAFFDPPTTLYMAAEKGRLDQLAHEWVDFDEIAPVMARSAVAAEDASFCTHWGFDMAAIRQVIDAGENRGASTISQQVVKNVYLWPARSWVRKALEALITPVMELVWSKRRILEVYLNMIEFDEGVFGVEAAAQHYFGVPAARLTADQAARLAAVLPAPKERSAAAPAQFVIRRAASIRDGAATILRDGRAACFED